MKRLLALLAMTCLMVSMFTTTPATAAPFDVYTTPGEHSIGGRQWRTWCEPYSQTARCRTDIKVSGRWVFNNLTYLPSARALWATNPLAVPGHHVIQGRKWYSECDTPATGRNGCRAYVESGGAYIFNNIVRFGVTPSNLEELYTYHPSNDPAPAPPAPPIPNYSISKGPNASNRVTLTFDDCPKTLADFKETVLGAEEAGIALVLFPTGNCILDGRFDAKFARAHGHYVFNHSITHPNLTKVSYATAVRELGSPGIVTTYGRPPYGAYNSTVQKAYDAVGMRVWTWNLDTLDWHGKTSEELVALVTGRAQPGNSVLLHMQWNGFNTETLTAMRDGLAHRGIGVCRNQGPTETRPAAITC